MEDGDLERISRSLGRFLRLGASRKVHARQAAAAGVVISQPGAVLLRLIVEGGPITFGELSARADMDPGATSRQVKALEDDGLVERRASTTDGRSSEVRATTAGRAVRRRLAEVTDRHMADVLATWSDADQHRFAALLDRFVHDLASVQYRTADRQQRSA